jgi:hypothetical protein
VRAALAGSVVAGLLALAAVAASWRGSPLRVGGSERSDVPSVVFLAAAGCAFVLYLLGLALLRRHGASLAAVCVIAAAIQLVPLAGPLLLSRDVYAYWAYGREVVVHDANPYAAAPGRFAADPATHAMAPAWRTTKSVYGPVFSAASAGLATTTGRSAEAASFAYRLLAAVGMLAIVGLAALVSPLPAFAVAFAGWNPLLALDFAGGGHNDVWMMVFVLGALALAARRPRLAGASWALAVGLKWIALPLVPLTLLGARRSEAWRMLFGFLLAAAVVILLALGLFGTHWPAALLPFAGRHAHWSIPSRLAGMGLPSVLALVPLVVAVPLLARSSARGSPRLAVTAGLALLATPWLLPWYAVWTVPLAAVEEDHLGWVLALGFCAYLLPDRVPI